MSKNKDMFLGQSLGSLPAAQRAERYRQFANDALRKAQESTDSERRAEYFSMASSWHAMATEMERTAGISAAALPKAGREAKEAGGQASPPAKARF